VLNDTASSMTRFRVDVRRGSKAAAAIVEEEDIATNTDRCQEAVSSVVFCGSSWVDLAGIKFCISGRTCRSS
jgi:hypothetical protein